MAIRKSIEAIPLLGLLFSFGVLRAQTPIEGPMIRRLADDRIELSWPADAPWLLEERASLTAESEWVSADAGSSVSNGRRQVVIVPSGTQRFFRLRSDEPLTIVISSPLPGETVVATTRESIFRLSRPLAPGIQVTANHLFAEVDGRRILSRIEQSTDRETLTIFYLENLPSSSRVNVTLLGQGLLDELGREIDADLDGQPGGAAVLEFTTASASPAPGTGVVGQVLAAERSPDGSNIALQGVTITVDGAEQTLRATTDARGFFHLSPCPSGRFFVHIDGRTVSNPQAGIRWPDLAYYPVVGKAWSAVAGISTNAAGGTGIVFLPRIPGDALTPVSVTAETVIGVAPSLAATNRDLAGVQIVVPPNALYANNGTRGGKVGIAPVPPDRLPGPLPVGLELPLVITVQTDGPENFDRPVPARFPNLPDPITGQRLLPGEKSALWSFNHDSGRWELQGPMTVSADGRFVDTDPGVGIRQPGWHGSRPGCAGGGGQIGTCGMSGKWEPLGKKDEEACKTVSTIPQGRAGYCLQFGRACMFSCQDCIEDEVAFTQCVQLCNLSAARCSQRSDICPWQHGPDE